MSTKNMTQADRVLCYIEDYGSITPLEAFRDIGVYRLASRISDLKKRGYPIKSEFESSLNRHGEKTRFMRYSLGGDGLEASRDG